MALTNLEVLDLIIQDCEQDVKDFEHAPFTGKTVGQLHGILEAKILALAKVIKNMLAEPLDIPFLAIGNNEPIPENLPEELKAELRKSRNEAGFDDDGNKIHNLGKET